MHWEKPNQETQSVLVCCSRTGNTYLIWDDRIYITNFFISWCVRWLTWYRNLWYRSSFWTSTRLVSDVFLHHIRCSKTSTPPPATLSLCPDETDMQSSPNDVRTPYGGITGVNYRKLWNVNHPSTLTRRLVRETKIEIDMLQTAPKCTLRRLFMLLIMKIKINRILNDNFP